MKVFATSDQHFMHFNIIKYANRPFDLSDEGIKECINTIVNKHNEIVSDDDLVLHLGDLGHGKNQSKEIIGYILENLKGKKILIKGNHDNWDDDFYLQYFQRVIDKFLLINGVFLCHYPCFKTQYSSDLELELIERVHKSKPDVIIHGHCHNKNPEEFTDEFKRINVSVDYTPNNFYPIEITNLIYK